MLTVRVDLRLNPGRKGKGDSTYMAATMTFLPGLNPGRKGKGDSSLIINSILSRTGIELGRHLCQVALPEWGWESP